MTHQQSTPQERSLVFDVSIRSYEWFRTTIGSIRYVAPVGIHSALNKVFTDNISDTLSLGSTTCSFPLFSTRLLSAEGCNATDLRYVLTGKRFPTVNSLVSGITFQLGDECGDDDVGVDDQANSVRPFVGTFASALVDFVGDLGDVALGEFASGRRCYWNVVDADEYPVFRLLINSG